VVSREDLADRHRFRGILVVVPVTSTVGLGPVYPVVQPYARGLQRPSTALVDMIRGIDNERVDGMLAPVPRADLERIDAALRAVLGL
jgi:mRNA-degrading endonuclease toxin of MazEF toxin-antitoxin module